VGSLYLRNGLYYCLARNLMRYREPGKYPGLFLFLIIT
jgi:hypothetical protein